MAKLTKSEIESQAIALLQEHIKKYEDATFWVTSNRGINLRTMYDIIRQNFYGVFKNDTDSYGQPKIWNPITEFMTWENIKGIDVDTKDINMKARHPKDRGKAEAMRYIVKDWMDKEHFGESLNEWLLPFVLDGHLIVKVLFVYDAKKKKKVLRVLPIDIRNTFFDPHGKGIQNEPFAERSVVDTSWFKQAYKDKYINLDKLEGRKNVPAIYDEEKEENSSNPQTEVFEFWSPMKKSWITGDRKDDNDYVECHLVVSNPSSVPLVHKLEINDEPDQVKPYEEVKFEDAPGRALGRGVGEKLIYLQMYLNMIFNSKRMNQSLAANQLFQYRIGSGLKPEQLRRLATGGSIAVEQIGDIARIDTRDFDYDKLASEEQNIVQVAQRTTQTQEPASGEQLPASMPATNAVIQNQAVRTSTALRQERVGLFLERLFSRQIKPRITELYSKEDILRITGDVDKVRSLFSKGAEYYAYKEALDLMEQGVYPSPEQLMMMKEQAMEKMENNEDMYIGIDSVDNLDCDIKFFVTGESIDKNALIQTLQQILFNYQNFAGNPDSQKIMRELFDILGLDSAELMPKGQQIIPQQGQPVGGAQIPQAPSEGQLLNQQENAIAGTAGI